MKCLILFSGKYKKNTINVSCAELAKRAVTVNKDLDTFTAFKQISQYLEILMCASKKPAKMDLMQPAHYSAEYDEIIIYHSLGKKFSRRQIDYIFFFFFFFFFFK